MWQQDVLAPGQFEGSWQWHVAIVEGTVEMWDVNGHIIW
jgi:hypothetical protein